MSDDPHAALDAMMDADAIGGIIKEAAALESENRRMRVSLGRVSAFAHNGNLRPDDLLFHIRNSLRDREPWLPEFAALHIVDP